MEHRSDEPRSPPVFSGWVIHHNHEILNRRITISPGLLRGLVGEPDDAPTDDVLDAVSFAKAMIELNTKKVKTYEIHDYNSRWDFL